MQFDWAREEIEKKNLVGGGVINGSFSTKDKNIFGFKINVKHNITFIKNFFPNFYNIHKEFFSKL